MMNKTKNRVTKSDDLSALIDVLPYVFAAIVVVGMATKLGIPQVETPKAEHKEPEPFKFLVRAFDFESM